MHDKRKILILSELLYPHGSGAELATFLWAKLLAEAGLQVRIITHRFRSEPTRTSQGNLEILRQPLIGSFGSKYSLLARPDLLMVSPVRRSFSWADVVYVPAFWYLAILAAKIHRKPVIAHVHDYMPICSTAIRYDLSSGQICRTRHGCRASCILAHERSHGRHIGPTLLSAWLNLTIGRCFGKLVALCDALVFVSKEQRATVVEYSPSLAAKSRVIRNPFPKFKSASITGDDMGYFGGPNPEKGYKVLLSALKKVDESSTIHATGFPERGSIRPSTKSRVLLYPRLPEMDFSELYRRIHTVLVPSIWAEPQPYVVGEALLQQRLVVASDIGGIPEMTEGCPGAFLFRSGDAAHLSKLIDYVLRLDRETRRELSLKNRKTFLRKFDDRRSLYEFSKLIQGTIATRSTVTSKGSLI